MGYKILKYRIQRWIHPDKPVYVISFPRHPFMQTGDFWDKHNNCMIRCTMTNSKGNIFYKGSIFYGL
jgi:G:T-mismatch repair DNA endonuclease (very short patch repair protein)